MTSGIYNRHKADLMNKNVDLANDDIKMMLMDDNHSFSESDDTKSDVDSNEISGTGYSTGGQSLSNKSVTQGSTTVFDADNVTWTDADFSTYHAVIYNADTNNLIASIDFGGKKSVSDADFKISWDSDGIITIS